MDKQILHKVNKTIGTKDVGGVKGFPKKQENFLEHYSVFLTQANLENYLNLSPFILEDIVDHFISGKSRSAEFLVYSYKNSEQFFYDKLKDILIKQDTEVSNKRLNTLMSNEKFQEEHESIYKDILNTILAFQNFLDQKKESTHA